MQVTWSIENQSRATNLGPGNRYVSGWNVYYVTSTGVHGEVWIPDTEYTEDRVKAVIGDRVALAARVGGMTGSVEV